MATTTNLYDVNDTVFHVNVDKGVRQGVVRSVDIALRPDGTPLGYTTTIEYKVQLVTAGQAIITDVESTLYADVDVALAAYKDIIV
jgi:hypothetical protein